MFYLTPSATCRRIPLPRRRSVCSLRFPASRLRVAGGRGKRGRGVGILGNVGRGLVVSPFQRERRDRRKRLGRRTRTVAGRRFTLAGKDDLGEREEEAEYCFKDFHKLEGFFNF